MKFRSFIVFFLWVIILSSCSIQKRHYRNGYHFERHHALATNELKRSPKDKGTRSEFEKPKVPIFTALVAAPQSASPDTCDLLLMRDGSTERVRVRQIDNTYIKYNRCDYLNGPMYVVAKNKVARVNYYNGSVDEFKLEHEHIPQPQHQKEKYPKEKIRKKTPTSSILAVIISSLDLVALCLILLFALFALILGSSLHLPALLFIVCIAVALTSIALAINGIKTIRDEPDLYKGIGNSVTAFVLNMITIIICSFSLYLILNP